MLGFDILKKVKDSEKGPFFIGEYMKLLVLILLYSVSAWSRLTDDQVVIKIGKSQINVTAKKGYHLNEEAPASISYDNLEDSKKPTVKKEALFSFKKNPKAKKAILSFYVCDDKKTVCEQHQKALNLVSGQIQAATAKPAPLTAKVYSLKSENKKPTLLVFSAPWCPACIRMQTETYNKPEVAKIIRKMNLLKLNSDLVENHELSEKFKIKAIPTMILLDKNGNETYRWLDFQPPKEFAQGLERQIKKVNQAEAILKNAQLGDAAAASTLAFQAYNGLDYAEALKWFSLTKSKKDQKFKLATEVMLAQETAEANEKLTEEYAQTLQKAISLTTSKIDQIRWTIDYLEKKKELKLLSDDLTAKTKELFAEIDKIAANKEASAKAFAESTYGNYAGFEAEELLWLKGRLSGIFEMKDEKTKTDAESIALISKRKFSDARPGEILMAISYLREAGETKKVTELYEQLIKKYPNSYVYFEKYARFLQKSKNLDKALSLTNQALKFPEGNEPQLSLLKSQILKDLNKKAEALSVIEETLKAENIGHKRFVKTVKRLNELKDEINKPVRK